MDKNKTLDEQRLKAAETLHLPYYEVKSPFNIVSDEYSYLILTDQEASNFIQEALLNSLMDSTNEFLSVYKYQDQTEEDFIKVIEFIRTLQDPYAVNSFIRNNIDFERYVEDMKQPLADDNNQIGQINFFNEEERIDLLVDDEPYHIYKIRIKQI
nr:MAG TPA: hypothetical protein [Bacteriophage sp.]